MRTALPHPIGYPQRRPLSGGAAGFRNTWASGTYDFTSTDGVAKLSHNESRFDSYFFAGDFAEVLNSFTQLVGRPFMVPIYGLGVRAPRCPDDVCARVVSR